MECLFITCRDRHRDCNADRLVGHEQLAGCLCLPDTDKGVDVGLAGAVAMLIAMVTVSSQALRAAMANPVRSLRSDIKKAPQKAGL